MWSGCPRRWPFLYYDMLDFTQCQEKPTDEPLAVLPGYAAVGVQVLFQVCKCPLYFVVGVRHSLASELLIGKQIWQVEVDAVHG